jgi:FHS family L-fucose permease-like MFS transporter
LACVLLLVAILFGLTKLPEIKNVTKEQTTGGSFIGTLRHKHLTWGVIAQFFYVGAQTCVISFFIKMAIQGGGFDEKTAGYYLAVYGGFFVVGRFIGTALLQLVKAPKLLAIYAILAAVLCAVAIVTKGAFVVYCLWGIGFFMSIMFPTIFGLGIDGLGEDTAPASSFMIMSIVGGAIIPYIMGMVVDVNHDRIQPGYIIPLICFLVVLYYGLNGYKIKKHLINA